MDVFLLNNDRIITNFLQISTLAILSLVILWKITSLIFSSQLGTFLPTTSTQFVLSPSVSISGTTRFLRQILEADRKVRRKIKRVNRGRVGKVNIKEVRDLPDKIWRFVTELLT